MKRIRTVFLLLLLITFITGCGRKITLHQPASEIMQVDLVYSPWGEHEILYSLKDEEVASFLDALLDIKLHKNMSPQDIGGSLIAQIVYSDGSVELLGDASVGYLSNGTWEHDGWYYVSGDDLYDLFSKHVDISQLPYI